ncbi:MAG: zinc ribbon domain-containing protein [Nitrospira sp.]|jgi:putative FmdB family regulatory protein|nr:zinc ribbon domain-containing protein [Nitrospira sp. BO4]
MPIFEYVCRECNHRFELLTHGSTAAVCPKCKATELDKQFSSFGVGATAGWASSGGSGACGSCGDPRGPGACSMN